MLSTLVLVAAAAAIFTVAHVTPFDKYPSVVVAEFVEPLTSSSTIQRIERIVGYPCTEFVLPNGLLLYVDSEATHLRIDAHLNIVAWTLVQNQCADLSVFQRNSSSFTRKRVDMNGNLAVIPALTPTSSVALRIVLHPGVESFASEYTIIDTILATITDSSAVAHVNSDPCLMHIVNVHRDHLDSLAAALMHDVRSLCRIEPLLEPELVNLWSASTIQVPFAMSADNVNAADACPDSICRPLWSVGLRGQGQLLAVSDTGLATSSCHFADTASSVPLSYDGSITADSGHAKVRLYWRGTGGDFVDSDDHGTHVCGTAVGHATGASDSPTSLSASDFNGVAPDARIVMIDSHSSGSGLIIPTPYDTQLLSFAWAAGARVHSGSWGVADFQYTDEDRRIDSFCWFHRSFVAVFAAGNSGESHGAASILSPALAKNALAVGAAMNGWAANDIASGNSPSYPSDAYAYDWLAAFSSRGGSALDCSWMKPNVVGAGGFWVWSAAATSPTSCSNVAATVIGLAGTSMSAPQVAAAALLIRQYFLDGFYFSTPFEPMGSLVRLLLILSTTPLRGVFPLQPTESSSAYAPYGRQYFEGYGRVSIVSVLPISNATAMAVLSNEHTQMTASGQVHRFCVQIMPSSPVDVVIGLVYTDYPSSTSESIASLVNDLDLRVFVDGSTVPHFPNGLSSSADSRSPTEVTRVTSTSGRLRIEVHATAIRFQSQSYALALTVLAASKSVLVEDVPVTGNSVFFSTSPSSSCLLCSSSSYRSSCPAATPTAMPSLPPPPVTTAVTTATTTPVTTSAPTSAPTLAPTVCAFGVSTVMRMWPSQLIYSNDTICCRAFIDFSDHFVDGSSGMIDPIFARLARHVITATVNNRRGVPLPLPSYLHLSDASNLLESHCDDGFVEHSPRTTALVLIDHLSLYNEGMCPEDSSSLNITESCSNEQRRADLLYCSGGSGTYDFDSNTCACDSSHHHSGNCASLHCSGNGASLASDSANSIDQCVCFAGWTGAQCQSCASPPSSDTRYLCVGLEPANVPSSLSHHTHALVVVSSSSVSNRLAGTYYALSSDKDADILPGTSGLDCRCSPIPLGASPSHADAAALALTYARDASVAYALAEPAPRTTSSGFPPPPTPTPTLKPTPTPTLKPTPTPTPNSGVKMIPKKMFLTGLFIGMMMQ